MRLAVILLSLALTTTASAWTVENMSPSRGTIGGGDVMKIVTTFRPTGPCDPFPCGTYPTVKFGTVEARSAITHEGVITVITPAHARGQVPVTVNLDGMGPREVGTYTFTDARDPFPVENYDSAILPVYVGGAPLPGANGSMWVSELWIANHGAHRVEVSAGMAVCDLNCAGKPYPGINPGQTIRIELPADGVNAARRLFIQKGGADSVTLSLRIRDVSRTDDNHGTEIPIPFESDFRRTASVVNVPLDNLSRAGMRIYSLSTHVQFVDVRVDVYSPAGGEKLASKTVRLQQAALAPAPTHDYVMYTSLGNLRSDFPTLPDGAYRFELTATDPVFVHGLAALVSLTNNRTQLVTAIPSY